MPIVLYGNRPPYPRRRVPAAERDRAMAVEMLCSVRAAGADIILDADGCIRVVGALPGRMLRGVKLLERPLAVLLQPGGAQIPLPLTDRRR